MGYTGRGLNNSLVSLLHREPILTAHCESPLATTWPAVCVWTPLSFDLVNQHIPIPAHPRVCVLFARTLCVCQKNIKDYKSTLRTALPLTRRGGLTNPKQYRATV